ncbi:MAG: hypothetical protein HKN14_04480 [Marinicaulis sp.]|nr:hypothetical protein [Marinicaulis sp.]NNE40158.1 hypothetical protein [Marinicaulis sp.]NNL88048.1 hypothetical protein [Marinicaulis sp.]
MRNLIFSSIILLLGGTLSGCALGLAAGAGAIVADEANESDGKFDPLEDTYDGNDHAEDDDVN